MSRTNEHEKEAEAGILSALVAIVAIGVAILDAAAEIVMITGTGAETELMIEIRIGPQDGTAETVMIGADVTVETLMIDEGVTAGTGSGSGVPETTGTGIRAAIEIYLAILVMIDGAIGIETSVEILAIAVEPHHDVISRPQKRRSRRQLSSVSLKLKPILRPSKKLEKRAFRFLDSTSRSRIALRGQTGVVVTTIQILASEMQILQA